MGSVPNRLASATSPYLLQHAENPVDWWEWGPEAFAEARRRDAPVLLSVGYAACHWCHVMAHESFEDEATAAYLNEHFVSVKVDREERPDVDAVYMQATVAMTGQGGWPMTCVLDHDGRPFFAGTYFPDRPRHGQPSFRQVLEAIDEAWHERREEVDQRGRADRATHLRRAAELAGERADRRRRSWTPRCASSGPSSTAVNGGFGGAPKFPPSMVLEFLLRHHVPARTTGTSPALAMAVRHARGDGARWDPRPARRGVRALLRGRAAGWCRTSRRCSTTTRLLLGVYTALGRPGRGPAGAPGRRARRQTSCSPSWAPREGGFASALDADSEGAEGTFYVWTPGPAGRGARRGGRSLGGAAARGHRAGHLRARRLDPAAAGRPRGPRRVGRGARRLLRGAGARERPARDDKVVAAWNGLAIAALVARRPAARRSHAAGRGAALPASCCWRPARRRTGRAAPGLPRRARRARTPASWRTTAAWPTGSSPWRRRPRGRRWLERAGLLLDMALERFAAGDGGFHDTADDAEALIARPRDPSDNASPVGPLRADPRPAAVRRADRLGSAPRRRRGGAARSVRPLAERAPRFAGWSLAAAEAALDGPVEVASSVAGPGDPDAAELAARARRLARCGRARRRARAHAAIPLLAGRDLVDGPAAAYVCRGTGLPAPGDHPRGAAS